MTARRPWKEASDTLSVEQDAVVLSGAGQEIQQLAAEEFMFAGVVGDDADDGLRLDNAAHSLCAGKEAGDIAELFPGCHRFGTLGGKTGGERRVQSDHPAAAVGGAVGHGDEIGIGRDPRILRGRGLHPDGGSGMKRGGKPDRPAVRVDPRHAGGTGAGPAARPPRHAYAGPFALDQRNPVRQSRGIGNLESLLTRPRSYTLELRPLIDQEVVDRSPA